MRDPWTIGIGALVVVVTIGVLGLAAVKLARAVPGKVVRAILAFAAILSTIPGVLYALYGA